MKKPRAMRKKEKKKYDSASKRLLKNTASKITFLRDTDLSQTCKKGLNF